MSTIFVFFYLACYMIALIPFLIIIRGRFDKYRGEIEKKVKRWALSMLKAAGVKVDISGLENIPEGNVIVICNHQGIAEIPIVLGYVKVAGMLAKIELSKIPIFSYLMIAVGCVFVDRNDKTQARAAVTNSIEAVKRGNSMVIFPEGTRSKDGEIGPFKQGAASIAAGAGVPVLPIVFEGSIKVFEEKKRVVRGQTVKVRILPPIDVAGLSVADRQRALNDIREKMIEVKKSL